MTDASETIAEEIIKLESRPDVGTTGSEEGLSPEVRTRMDESRGRAQDVTDNLELELEGNAALGYGIAGDAAGEGLVGSTDEQDREAATRVAGEQAP